MFQLLGRSFSRFICFVYHDASALLHSLFLTCPSYLDNLIPLVWSIPVECSKYELLGLGSVLNCIRNVLRSMRNISHSSDKFSSYF